MCKGAEVLRQGISRGVAEARARAGPARGRGCGGGRSAGNLSARPRPCAPPPAPSGPRLRVPSFPGRAGGPLRLQAADGLDPSLADGFLLFFWTAMNAGPVRRLPAQGGRRS